MKEALQAGPSGRWNPGLLPWLPSELPSERGTSAGSELVPQRSNHECGFAHCACVRPSPRHQGQHAARQQVVRVEVVKVGRRLVPSARERAQMVDRMRGVNDPGAAWPMRPRPLSEGVVHAPPCQCPMRRADDAFCPADSPEEPRHYRAPNAWVISDYSDGHHVREDARSARRRARFSAALRPRAVRAARACP
jgi:hypothetical protein